jgi:catechol 2,3-dioxygenase-like lactoylglutathione lyase family enzyme
MGVPNVEQTADYYTEFGLVPDGDGWFRTRDGGRQLHIVYAPSRRLVELRIGADDADDIARVRGNLQRLGIPAIDGQGQVSAVELATGARAVLEVAPRLTQAAVAATAYNGPGRYERLGERAPGVLRTANVQPRKLGHVVVGSTDLAVTRAFFVAGFGFKVSDHIKDHGSFLRCSIDHHNLLVMAAPVNFLHHTSWQVDDLDDVGRGAFAMLEGHPERHSSG